MFEIIFDGACSRISIIFIINTSKIPFLKRRIIFSVIKANF